MSFGLRAHKVGKGLKVSKGPKAKGKGHKANAKGLKGSKGHKGIAGLARYPGYVRMPRVLRVFVKKGKALCLYGNPKVPKVPKVPRGGYKQQKHHRLAARKRAHNLAKTRYIWGGGYVP